MQAEADGKARLQKGHSMFYRLKNRLTGIKDSFKLQQDEAVMTPAVAVGNKSFEVYGTAAAHGQAGAANKWMNGLSPDRGVGEVREISRRSRL